MGEKREGGIKIDNLFFVSMKDTSLGKNEQTCKQDC